MPQPFPSLPLLVARRRFTTGADRGLAHRTETTRAHGYFTTALASRVYAGSSRAPWSDTLSSSSAATVADASSLFISRRGQASGSSKNAVEKLTMVARRTQEPETVEDDVDMDTGAAEEGLLREDAAVEVEEDTVMEFTEEEAKRLERSFQRPVGKREYLPPSDRDLLSKMIYKKFYRELTDKHNKEAMQYQAGLEVTWIEEWAESAITTDFQRKGRHQHVGSTDFVDTVRRLIKRSVLERVDFAKPLSYIIGVQPFYGCDIVCRPPLLCPRPETEMWTQWLCHNYLKKAEPPRPLKVLDMCCGTGCIGVAIAKNVPAAHVTAVDLLPVAVDTARENAANNGIPPERYEARQSDMFDIFFDAATKGTYPKSAISDVKEEASKKEGARAAPAPAPAPVIAQEHHGTFDILVSNPPYVLPEQYVVLPLSILNWESKTALVGDDCREHKQYLYFKELCEYGRVMLKPKRARHPALREAPNVAIEVGLQAHVVASIMERSGWFDNVEVHLDYAQQERWVTACSKH